MQPKGAGTRFSPRFEPCGCAVCSSAGIQVNCSAMREGISTTEPPKTRRERGTEGAKWHRTATLIPWLIPAESQGYSSKKIRKKVQSRTQKEIEMLKHIANVSGQ